MMDSFRLTPYLDKFENTSKSSPKVSIILPARNEEEFIGKCLDSLIEQDYENEFKRTRSRYSMPGFRKGKVPEQIVKKNLGPSIEPNFAENSINTYYRKALDELQLTPINQVSIDIKNSDNK